MSEKNFTEKFKQSSLFQEDKCPSCGESRTGGLLCGNASFHTLAPMKKPKKKREPAPEAKLADVVRPGTTMNVLALDLSTKTGWCTRTASGTWNLTPKKDESKGMRIIRFKSKIIDIIKAESINLVVFERPAGQHAASIIVQSELQGFLKLYCEENKIEYFAFSASEIKKFATGKGNSGKPEMIAAAQRRWKMTGNDDNEADAMHIYHKAIEDLHL